MERAATSLAKLASSFGLLFFNGFILWKMWEWFIVPLGAMIITYWHALGLYTIIVLVTSRLPQKSHSHDSLEDFFKARFIRLFILSMLFGIAYLISGQM